MNDYIETKQLILRLPKEEDSAALFEILGNAETIKYMSMDPFPSEEFVRECIGRWAARKNEKPDYVFSIVEKSSGNVAGMINTCGLHNEDPVVAYCLRPKYWGKGYMTEALLAFNQFLFEKGFSTLVIDAVDANFASNAVIRKAGFGYIGSSMESLSELKPEKVKILEYRMIKDSHVKEDIRNTEEALQSLMSVKEDFSENIIRYKDAALPDMYDLNQFVYTSIPDHSEIKKAFDYQKNQGDDFIKFEGKTALSGRLVKEYGLEECPEITMMLTKGNPNNWTRNTKVLTKNLKDDPEIKAELLSLELATFGTEYGEDFTERKMNHWFEIAEKDNGLNFYAAYLDGKIAGSLFTFRYGEYLLIDGLVVDEWARNKYVATTLLADAIKSEGGIAFLHADPDDTPKVMYVKLGFRLADYKYGYFRKW